MDILIYCVCYRHTQVENMGKINVVVDDKVEKKFRDTVFKRKGMKKGNLTDAVEEAMLLWVTSDTGQKKE